MKEIDNTLANDRLDEEELFLKYVVRGDYELFYLHCYLEDIFLKKR